MPAIPRATLRRCICCGNYHPLDNMIGQTFRAGKHRFNICLPCWREDNAPRQCLDCGVELTAFNTELRLMPNGGWRNQSSYCQACWGLHERRNKAYRDLVARYPNIVKK